MTIFSLLFRAESANVQEIKRFPCSMIFVAFLCTKCGETTKAMGICPEDTVDIPNSRGDTNLHYKCKGCDSRCNVDIVSESVYVAEDAKQQGGGKGVCLATIECRGSLQPTSWYYEKLEVTSASGAKFPAAGSEKDWCEYDEELEEQIEVMEMEFTVN